MKNDEDADNLVAGVLRGVNFLWHENPTQLIKDRSSKNIIKIKTSALKGLAKISLTAAFKMFGHFFRPRYYPGYCSNIEIIRTD